MQKNPPFPNTSPVTLALLTYMASLAFACVPAGKEGFQLRVLEDPPAIDGARSSPRDAFVFPDARADAGAQDVSASNCAINAGPIDMNGSPDPLRLIEVQNHGLPGCYRCQLDVADFDGDGRVDVVMAGAFDSAFVPG